MLSSTHLSSDDSSQLAVQYLSARSQSHQSLTEKRTSTMSLKKFVISGIQDVLENQLNKGRNQQHSSCQNSQISQDSSYSNPMSHGYTNSMQQSGYSGHPPQNQSYYSHSQSPEYPSYSGPSNRQNESTPYPQGDPRGYSRPNAPPPIGFNIGPGGGYPPQQGEYPPQQGEYPPQQGYPEHLPYGVQGLPNYPQGGGYPHVAQENFRSGYYHGQGYGSQQIEGGGQLMLGTPSIRSLPNFNANQDAEVLRKAMKGLGCNNSKVISVLCGRTNWQRQEIAKAFKVMYGKDLIKDLKSELSGDFEDLILALMEPPAVYDAKQLHKAMEGLGTKESVLIEIMTSRTNQQIAGIRTAYRQLYNRELERDLIGETSGNFKRLLVSLCAGGRDEGNYTDHLKANQDAHSLYNAGERRLGTDESCFNAILASQNFSQLRSVFEEYQKISNHSIEKAIDSEFSGDIRDGLLSLITVIRNRPAYFAKLLYDSMKGFGTRDNDLIRLVVTRCEYDMSDIRSQFQILYKNSLENMIKGDCSGSYKDGLIALVIGNGN